MANTGGCQCSKSSHKKLIGFYDASLDEAARNVVEVVDKTSSIMQERQELMM